jgi:hypothetical protein
VPSKKFLEIATKTKSFSAVNRNGWVIKFSMYRDTQIMVLVRSDITGQLFIRQFNNEDEACLFLNILLELDPANTYEL